MKEFLERSAPLVVAFLLYKGVVAIWSTLQRRKDLAAAPGFKRSRSPLLWIALAVVFVSILFGLTATAICGDGSLSWSSHHSGTCSSHGGVRSWL
jgi:hypothetical protein